MNPEQEKTLSELKPCPACEGEMIYEDDSRTWLECGSCYLTMTADDYAEAEPLDTPLRRERDAIRSENERLREIISGGQWSNCPQCGIFVDVDEDGCCAGCGSDSMMYAYHAHEVPCAEENERLRQERDTALAAAKRPYMDGELIAAYEGWVDYGDEYDSFSTSRDEVGGDVTPVAVFFVKRGA